MKKTSVLLVDDHQLFREGLRLLLSNLPFISVINEAANGQEFLKAIDRTLPGIVFMDIEMPVMNGIMATKAAVELYPDIRIVALSMYGEEEYVKKMIAAGARGFILKNSGIQEVEEAIFEVISGNNYFSQPIINTLALSFTRKSRMKKTSELTDREIEILFNICKGYSNKEIADMLFLSKRTIDKHRENLLLKTGSKNTAGLVIYAVRSGIVEL